MKTIIQKIPTFSLTKQLKISSAKVNSNFKSKSFLKRSLTNTLLIIQLILEENYYFHFSIFTQAAARNKVFCIKTLSFIFYRMEQNRILFSAFTENIKFHSLYRSKPDIV